MAWALFLLSLFSYCSGATSQPTLTQSPSQSVGLGQTAKLTCTVSSNKNTICWVQQKSGQSPRYIQCTGGNRGEGVSNRFTASDSGNVGSLTITNTQPEDEADYHCHMWYSSGSQVVFGGGTTLTVTGGPSSPPTVHLFPPSPEEKESKEKVTMVCLVNDFSPSGISLIWQADGNTLSKGVETTKPTKISDKYAVSSYLTLTHQEWESQKTYTCKVMHEGIEYVKSVSHSQCP